MFNSYNMYFEKEKGARKNTNKTKTSHSGTWVDVENPREDDVFFLERESGILRKIVLDCLDENEVPRAVSEDAFILVIVRVPPTETEV